MATQAQLKANAKYKAEKTKKVLIEFYPSDMELYDHLQKQDKKQTFIKELIRQDKDESKKQQPARSCRLSDSV